MPNELRDEQQLLEVEKLDLCLEVFAEVTLVAQRLGKSIPPSH